MFFCPNNHFNSIIIKTEIRNNHLIFIDKKCILYNLLN